MLPDESINKDDAQENSDAGPYKSLSECSRTPSLLSAQEIDYYQEEEDAKYGDICIIQLYKGKKPLGIHLVESDVSTSEGYTKLKLTCMMWLYNA